MRDKTGKFVTSNKPWNLGLKNDPRLGGPPKGHPYWGSDRKGKTLEELYGKERADKIKLNSSKGWFKRGVLSSTRPFLKGHIPWNKNLGKGIKTQRKKEINFAKHQVWRKKVFERDNYTCQFCKKKGGELNADHIKLWSIYPKLRYRMSNGQTLCKGCHKEKTAKDLSRYWKNQFAVGHSNSVRS